MFSYPFFILLLVALLAMVSARTAADTHESCEFWASIGECAKNPSYMLSNCATSCADFEKSGGVVPESFYDIAEKDLFGNDFSFDAFRGKVVFIVNVASYCGYTAENYALFRRLKKYISSGLEIVLAPCNQFGGQEPADAANIAKFIKKEGFEGIILQKNDVNGPQARQSFRYLKRVTGKAHIEWNFDGKFLVSRDGRAYLPSDDVEADIRALLDGEEL